MFSADRASLDIVNNICIYAGPVHCFSGLGLHFLHSLVHAVEVSKGPVEALRGDAYLVSLQQDTILNGDFIPGAPEVSGDPWDLLEVVRPPSKGEVVQGVVDWITLYSSSNGIDFTIG